MHASHSTIRTHEDHMNSTRDETPSLQLSMALARGGSTIAADSSFRPACFRCSVHIKCSYASLQVSSLRFPFIAHDPRQHGQPATGIETRKSSPGAPDRGASGDAAKPTRGRGRRMIVVRVRSTYETYDVIQTFNMLGGVVRSLRWLSLVGGVARVVSCTMLKHHRDNP